MDNKILQLFINSSLAKKVFGLIPPSLKTKIANFPNPYLQQQNLYRSLLNKGHEIRLIFNEGIKNKGYVTIGFSPKCNLNINSLTKIKVNFPNNSVEEVYLDKFVEQINDQNILLSLFQECSRLLKNGGLLKITFRDVNLSKLVFTKKWKLLPEKFRLVKKRFLSSIKTNILNDIYFSENKISRFVDKETLKKLLLMYGFDHIKFFDNNQDFTSTAYANKNNLKQKLALTASKFTENSTEVKKDAPIYLSFCDSINIIENILNINTSKIINRNFASVIGSAFFINLLPFIKPKKILLFDSNNLQVRYMKLIIEVISKSDSFEQFTEYFFSRKYQESVDKFLKSKPKVSIINKVRKLTSDKYIYDQTLGKIAKSDFVLLNDILPVLKIDNNSLCQHITISNKEYFKPGPEVNVFYIQYLKKHFKYIKSILQKAIVKNINLEDKYVSDFLQENGLIFVSNIGENDWIYEKSSDRSLLEINNLAKQFKLADSLHTQWLESYLGFKKFFSDLSNNFWIIDAAGNIFNTNELFLNRASSHSWLWQEIKPYLYGKTLELIHMEDGQWGFKEHLKTVNVNKYIARYQKESFDTILFHILLGNNVDTNTFIKALRIAAKNTKRIIILEHDRDSENFGKYSSPNITDIRFLLNIIRTVDSLKKACFHITWTGASKKIDERMNLEKANYNRNILIVLDL